MPKCVSHEFSLGIFCWIYIYTLKMVKVTQLIMILIGLWALYYVVQYLNGNNPLKNAGSLIMDAVEMNVQPEVAVASPETAIDDPWDAPIPGSPESSLGGSIDRVNWDGLPESQLQGALSKQYQELTAEDLLPHNDMAHWADIYPNGVGQLQNKNFLHSGHHVGINTVGQSLKNANQQIRSEPPNPQLLVSPWLNSSYGPDLTRKSLEISNCD
jgi:hypothetical protein